MVIGFRVAGLPYPQGSKRIVTFGGVPRLINAGGSAAQKKHKAWRKAVHDSAIGAMVGYDHLTFPLDEPLEVTLTFWLPPTGDKYRTRHATTPDIDKLARSTLDGLTTSGIIVDDSRVSVLAVSKMYGEETGCRISIHPLGTDEQNDRERLKDIAARIRKTQRQGAS